MDKNELFKASGLPGEIDCALPDAFNRQVLETTGHRAGDLFVWWYAPNNHEEYAFSGKPLSLARLYALAIANRKLLDVTDVRPTRIVCRNTI